MKKSAKMSNMLNVVSTLSKAEQATLVEQIMAMMQETGIKEKNTCHNLVEGVSSAMPDCPHCGAKATLKKIVRSGFKANGAQRYTCNSCGKTFVPTTGTAFAWTKKDAETWKKYIHLTISGASLQMCAYECNISYQTAFNWRHKILHVFEEHQKSTQLSGKIEVDEMLIPLNFKGNHVQGDFGARKLTSNAINDMPRKAYHRGTDNKSASSKNKACVFCMVQDGRKAFYAAVPGVGFMTKPMLDATVVQHVDKDNAVMLADNYKITHNYFEENGFTYTILSSNTSDNPNEHKPEVRDGLHLQHVNAMHRHIRQFLAPYCGVSSKYLSHYISLFVWLKAFETQKQKREMDTVSIARASSTDCYIATHTIWERPAVPVCA